MKMGNYNISLIYLIHYTSNLTEQGVEEYIINNILGHATRTRSTDNYSTGTSIEIMNRKMKLLKYDIQFDLIRRWI